MARDYNPRYGRGQGRVGDDDVSFDGKSWAYREPGETLDRPLGRKQAFIDEAGYNEHAQKMLNPLYNFAYGDVEAAARKLGIGNYNTEEEVAQTVDYLRNRFNQSEDTAEDAAPKPEYVPDPGTSFTEADSISDQLASARAYAPTYQDAMKSGSLNPTSDDYQANADDFLNAYQNRFMDISNRVRGVG
tara:strand:- start:3167 stop:3730 length:564 start_codon:yes stop_codon:yes gene_type:complete